MQIVIKPKKGLLVSDIKEWWHYRELFYFLAWRDIKLRYKQTVLGIAWAALQPFLMMVIFSIVFGRIANIPSDNIPYPIFSYAGLLFWNMFSNSLSNSSQSLVGNPNLIQKVYLPRLILPAAAAMVTLVDFFFASFIFGGILLYYQFTPHVSGLLFLPLAILITLTASLGMGSFLAALNVKYRDVRYVLPFFIQLMIFITPVIYPISIVSDKYRWILALNPMAGVIETFKALFLGTGQVNVAILAISAGASIAFLIFGIWYFLRMEKTFADLI